MGIYHNVTMYNQSKHTIQLDLADDDGDDVEPICSCFDMWGPESFVLGPGEKRLLLLRDDNGWGRCDDEDKYISWHVSDRASNNRIVTYHVVNDNRYGWCVVVQGPAVFAETGGNACLPNMCWVGRSHDSDNPVQVTIFL